MNAQQKDSIAGEYYLEGVMETASVIQLNPDFTFKFFYSYGALDRYGSGKWAIEDNIIELNSRPRPALDFKLTGSKLIKDSFTIIKIDNKNPQLLKYIVCIVKSGSHDQEQNTDGEGIAQFPKQKIDSISLLFQLCPDRFSTFAIDNSNNYFEFNFEPWIAEIFFEHFQLAINKNKLTGKHPLLAGTNFSYIKGQ